MSIIGYALLIILLLVFFNFKLTLIAGALIYFMFF